MLSSTFSVKLEASFSEDEEGGGKQVGEWWVLGGEGRGELVALKGLCVWAPQIIPDLTWWSGWACYLKLF